MNKLLDCFRNESDSVLQHVLQEPRYTSHNKCKLSLVDCPHQVSLVTHLFGEVENSPCNHSKVLCKVQGGKKKLLLVIKQFILSF